MGISVTTGLELSGAVVLTVRGEIEHGDAEQIHGAVREAVDGYRPALLYVDLGLVTFLGPGGAAALLASQRVAASVGTRLVIRNPSPAVRQLVGAYGFPVLFA